mgnify:FL=1
MREKFDFSGWATRNDLECSDGRIIRKDAFADDDGKTVPLVWMHQHNDPENVLGHAMLVNEKDGVRAYGVFNNTDMGRLAKELVSNGDIKYMSICANKLKQNGSNVLHGAIREVSLVLAGANPGALIDNPMLQHSDGSTEYELGEAIIYSGYELCHADDDKDEESEKEEEMKKDKTVQDVLATFNEEQKQLLYYLVGTAAGADDGLDENEDEVKHADSDKDGNTLKDIFETLNEEQKNVLYFLVGKAKEEADGKATNEENDEDDDEGEDEEKSMKHNVFEQDYDDTTVLTHADMSAVLADAKRCGSFKQALESYAENTLQHSINDIQMLFPEEKNVTDGAPAFVKRDDAWVTTVFNNVHKSPFSRVKTVFANITEDDARAKGYIKGKQKKEEVFGLLKRTTTPQTVYKLQKFDRDDVIDITDFDVVAWVKGEMRVMLNEEIARAVLVGDGRASGAEDKINEQNIRPIWKDDDFYTIHKSVTIAPAATNYDKAEAIIEAALRARKDYKGSGTPDAFFDPDTITTMLLAKDTTGRRIYNSISDLASALRVKNIYEVPVFEGLERTDAQSKKHTLLGIIVNLTDYNIGADKGGSVNLFDDFDIDYNKFTYLIETRCSGALVRPYSAIVIETAPTE